MISIVIPVLNEAETIEKLLFHLVDNTDLNSISEIIVVDGGSTDGTQKLVKDLDLSIQVLHSEKGRAKQMNLGAKAASGGILYFLHADSFPPNRYDKYIIEEIKKGNNAGCFRLQFDHNHWWLRLASWLTQFRWRACRGGDQSQFITKELFNEIGGFDESYIIYEDNILINELYARNEFVVINKKIKTSARLYERHGIWKLQYHFWAIYVKKWFGASADDLFAYYKKHISC
ncbi:TIGR04283 family arsenosugar biosynthesis glycosyltransferase [Winogradskyella sp. A3E31]|uniref:TIGR04283 family arsenosugar biosynthesis glycosyltransferase n=1 Tax=Winogradskyella sp. A3E31 TaxID=3349637 RepID=UPI00398B14E5